MYKSNNNTQLATLCYLRKEGKVLLINRNKSKEDVHFGKWNGLGGKFMQGESPEECVIREVKEESGLDIFNPMLRGILTFPQFSHGKDWYVFVFTSNSHDGTIRENHEGSLEWIKAEEVLSLPLWEGDKVFLPLVFGNKFFTGKFLYKDKVLIEHNINTYKTNE